MKKLAAIVIGTVLLVSCSSKPTNKQEYSIEKHFKNSGINNTKNYTEKEIKEVLERHLYSAMAELESGSRSEFLKKYLKEFHREYIEDALELIINEDLYKKKFENEIGEKSM